MMIDPKPVILDVPNFQSGIQRLREIAERPVPGECGLQHYYATDAARFIREVRTALIELGQEFASPELVSERAN